MMTWFYDDIFYSKMLIYLVFDKSMTNRRTDGRTDGRTEGRTDHVMLLWLFFIEFIRSRVDLFPTEWNCQYLASESGANHSRRDKVISQYVRAKANRHLEKTESTIQTHFLYLLHWQALRKNYRETPVGLLRKGSLGGMSGSSWEADNFSWPRAKQRDVW